MCSHLPPQPRLAGFAFAPGWVASERDDVRASPLRHRAPPRPSDSLIRCVSCAQGALALKPAVSRHTDSPPRAPEAPKQAPSNRTTEPERGRRSVPHEPSASARSFIPKPKSESQKPKPKSSGRRKSSGSAGKLRERGKGTPLERFRAPEAFWKITGSSFEASGARKSFEGAEKLWEPTMFLASKNDKTRGLGCFQASTGFPNLRELPNRLVQLSSNSAFSKHHVLHLRHCQPSQVQAPVHSLRGQKPKSYK